MGQEMEIFIRHTEKLYRTFQLFPTVLQNQKPICVEFCVRSSFEGGVRCETHFFYSIECVIWSEWWYFELYSMRVVLYWSNLHLVSIWETKHIHTHTIHSDSISFNKFYRETSWKSFPHFGSLCNIRKSVAILWTCSSPNFSIHNKCLMLLHIVQKVLGCDDVVKLILVEVYAKK